MTEKSIDNIRLDDLLELRKPHPCGSYVWRVTRVGAEIGLTCTGCGRKVRIHRSKLRKRLRAFVERENG